LGSGVRSLSDDYGFFTSIKSLYGDAALFKPQGIPKDVERGRQAMEIAFGAATGIGTQAGQQVRKK
jgi:hypothetical protein